MVETGLPSSLYETFRMSPRPGAQNGKQGGLMAVDSLIIYCVHYFHGKEIMVQEDSRRSTL
jgi:hypothetical protein